jgi:hypothetical protein
MIIVVSQKHDNTKDNVEYFNIFTFVNTDNFSNIPALRPLLWSSGHSPWLQTQRSQVRLQALPDILSSSGSKMGSTQPRSIKEELLEREVAVPV